MSDTDHCVVDGKVAQVCRTLDALGLMHALIPAAAGAGAVF